MENHINTGQIYVFLPRLQYEYVISISVTFLLSKGMVYSSSNVFIHLKEVSFSATVNQ